MTSIEEKNIFDHRDYLFTQANILSNQLIAEFKNLSQPHTNDYYSDVVVNFSKEIGSRILIIDAEGHTLVDSYSEFTSDDPIINAELDEAINGRQSSGVYRFDEIGRVIYVSVPVQTNTEVMGAILITSSLEATYESLAELLSNMFLLAAVCIGFTVAISFIFV